MSEHNDNYQDDSVDFVSDIPDNNSDFSADDLVVPTHHRHHHHTEEPTDQPPATEEDFDDFVFVKRQKSQSHHRQHSEDSDPDTIVRSHTESHFRVKNNRQKNEKWQQRPWWQKTLIILGRTLAAIAILLLLLFICIITLRELGLTRLTNYENIDISAPEIESSIDITNNGKRVNYKGQEYLFNENVTSIMCIGVDKGELGTTDGTVGTGGQGDALYLIALDTKTGKTTVIAVPRDIVTDIGVYSSEGEYLGTEKRQLCLAYAYGDGRKTSCLNTVQAVSRLMYNIPINSYYAIDTSAIISLNDAIGGVTVTLTDDTFYDQYSVHHFKGEVITLHGIEALRYVRQREVKFLESSTYRMNHQITYLKEFSKTAINMTKSDITTPVKLYNIIADNSETNLSTSTITVFATTIIQNGVSELDFVTVPGTLKSGGTYAEYKVDKVALYEMILDVYYTPIV